MAAKKWIDRLNKFTATRRIALNSETLNKMAQRETNYAIYNKETQDSIYGELFAKAAAQQANEFNVIRQDIATEAKEARAAVDRVKYPLRYSVNTFDKSAGLAQQTNALLFLGTRPTRQRIAAELRGAFDRGEVDYAYTLADNCMNDAQYIAPGITQLTEEQKALRADVDAALKSFPGTAKIAELGAEVDAYATVEKIVAEFDQSTANGWKTPNSVTLMGALSEADQKVMAADWVTD